MRDLGSRLAALVAVAALGIVGVFAGPAAAGGHSGDARACQKGGWETLQTATGESFKNQGACVSYAAHGGAFLAPCLESSRETFLDVRITGPLDTAGNLTIYESYDGTCTGGVDSFRTVVTAAGEGEANVDCAGLGAGSAAFRLSSEWPAAPLGVWICIL